jgi:predicted Fe-S protein YdhL (DUF1289 family)
VDSPCIACCKLNADKICLGCYRHIEEIVDWNKRSEAEQLAVYDAIAKRKEWFALQEPNSMPTSPITQAEWQQAKAALAQKRGQQN